MKKIILITIIALTVGSAAFSQSKQESIKELFKLMQLDSLVAKVVKSYTLPLMYQRKGVHRDSAAQAESVKSNLKNLAMLKDIMSRLINEDLVPIYDKYFTEAELNDFITFYKSPSGQKLIGIQPDIQKDLTSIMLKKYMPAVMDSVKKQRGSEKDSYSTRYRLQDSISKEQVYQVVEQMPQYPGGQDELAKFLGQHIKYPEAAKKDSISGRVYVQFVVNKTGQINNVKLVRGIGGGCDEEAIRVVKMMPLWTPALQNGKPVSVFFNLPIVFTLGGRPDGEKIYQIAEQMPEFVGGQVALDQYLTKNIKYPDAAKSSGISGRVFIQFVVDKGGFIHNVKLVRGIGGGCDEEAMRVVKKMAPWHPGKQNGLPVSVYFNIPVDFPMENK